MGLSSGEKEKPEIHKRSKACNLFIPQLHHLAIYSWDGKSLYDSIEANY